MGRNLVAFLLFFITISSFSQEFSRKDSLRGNLTPIRTCYDVTFYDLKVMIDEQEKSIERSYNIIHFTALTNFSWFQIDLASNMEVQIIEFEKSQLEFSREFDAVYVYFNREVKKGEQLSIKVWYGGYPRVAVNAPWDGGFSWKKDSNGNPWIGVSCQGLGASVWWPNKDHQSDEPDSMRITCTARYPLKIIANGDLRSDTSVWNQYLESWVNVSEWFVSYPINNYNVTLNIGDYTHFSDSYISLKDTLRMDYYVLHDNLEKAKEHFKQVKPMMKCFENYFGEYPFWNDGYALVETPYLGMEHQSAIAYGNDYLPGYHGNTRFIDGLAFDFIIVHESGHEWWGNSITTNDIADMWVHEGFCTYSEVLYVECMHGYDAMLSYVNNQKRSVRNDKAASNP
ncbi:MAG: M1 family metallopeptidase [Flavobacteriales bacterium]|nr:M1 family metallopeptidase [Flavobacteriales bacterium]